MKATIERGDICIGIEFGSTRIKAVVTDENGRILASGSTIWENKFENGAWIYTKEQILYQCKYLRARL